MQGVLPLDGTTYTWKTWLQYLIQHETTASLNQLMWHQTFLTFYLPWRFCDADKNKKIGKTRTSSSVGKNVTFVCSKQNNCQKVVAARCGGKWTIHMTMNMTSWGLELTQRRPFQILYSGEILHVQHIASNHNLLNAYGNQLNRLSLGSFISCVAAYQPVRMIIVSWPHSAIRRSGFHSTSIPHFHDGMTNLNLAMFLPYFQTFLSWSPVWITSSSLLSAQQKVVRKKGMASSLQSNHNSTCILLEAHAPIICLLMSK